MTQSFTDPGDVCLTGQNPFMMLFSGDGPPSSIVSFWRVHFSPASSGHALYVRSELTGGAPRIYSDNVPLARYIQSEIYAHNARPFGFFAALGIDVADAAFAQSGDPRSALTETVRTAVDEIELTWSDFLPAFKGATAANAAEGRGHGHYALYIPARHARFAINGTVAAGEPRPAKRDGRDNSSAGLAWSETWVRPR
jgi:hypothetical protein